MPAHGRLSTSQRKGAVAAEVKHPKGKLPALGAFAVDPPLSAEAYGAKRRELYACACMAWNELDGSPRHRIPMVITMRYA